MGDTGGNIVEGILLVAAIFIITPILGVLFISALKKKQTKFKTAFIVLTGLILLPFLLAFLLVAHDIIKCSIETKINRMRDEQRAKHLNAQ